MSAEQKRPPLPDPLMREVRQRCGFGCVICGLPLYEYEHMLGWAETERHVAEEITLLCDRHHREKTNKLLPASMVQAANANPYNLRAGVTPPFLLHFGAQDCSVNLGGNVFWTSYRGDGTFIIPVSVDATPLIAFVFEQGRLLLTLQIFDEFNQPILRVLNNELQYVPEPWDIEFTGHRIVVREAARKILIEIDFRPPNQIIIPRARLMCNGVQVLVKPDEVVIPAGNRILRMARNIKASQGGGIVIGPHPFPIGSMWRLDQVPRYAQVNSAVQSWADEVFPGNDKASITQWLPPGLQIPESKLAGSEGAGAG